MIVVAGVVLIAVFNSFEYMLGNNHENSVFKNKDPYSFFGRYGWMRKYKYGNPQLGEAFFGSTSFLIWTTNGENLFKFLWIFIGWGTLFFGELSTNHLDWWWTLSEILTLMMVYRMVFNLLTKDLLKS